MLELKSPLFVQFEITSKCNNKCGYCYNYWRRKSDIDSDLSTNLSVINDLAINDIKSIIITGGEPFLSPFLIDILRYCDKKRIITMINTNGRLISDEYVEELKKIKLLSSVNISLNSIDPKIHDSTTNITGSWEDTINGLNLCVENRINVIVNMTLTHFNVDQIYDLAKYTHNLKAHFGFTRFIPFNRELKYFNLNKNDIFIISNQLNKLKNENIRVKMHTPFPLCALDDYYDIPLCTGGFLWCAISPDLNVRPCTLFEKSYGNLKNESINSIWEKMSTWRYNFTIPETCLKCEKFDNCRGGCRKIAEVNGDIKGFDPLTNLNRKKWNDKTNNSDLDYDKLTIKPNTIFRLKYDYQIRKENFGYVVLFGLYPLFIRGEVSLDILKMINGQNSLLEIIDKIKNQYRYFDNSVENDVQNFVYSLHNKNLLWIVGS